MTVTAKIFAAATVRKDSSREKLRQLSRFVTVKISTLNKGLTEGRSDARASLARLRRGADGTRNAWMLVGEDLFTDDPDNGSSASDLFGPDDYGHRYLTAAMGALYLYAIHRQSKPGDVNTDDPRASFGRACRQIGRQTVSDGNSEAPASSASANTDVDSGVHRRLTAMERATDFPSTMVWMRGLITMIHSTEGIIPINYGRLACDLYALQIPDRREDVFRRWSQDFFTRSAGSGAGSVRK